VVETEVVIEIVVAVAGIVVVVGAGKQVQPAVVVVGTVEGEDDVGAGAVSGSRPRTDC